MVTLYTTEKKIAGDKLRDGDWVIGDFGDQLTLLRYQDSLMRGDFRPVLVTKDMLEKLGFTLSQEQPEGSEAEAYQLNNFHLSVINDREYIAEGGSKGRVSTEELHVLQQLFRQHAGEELVTDFLEQPHEIIVMDH